MKGKKTPQSSAVFELKTYRSVVNPLAHFATLLNNNFGKKLFIGYLTTSQGNATASWIVCRASAEQRKIITFFLTLIFKIFMVKSCFRNKLKHLVFQTQCFDFQYWKLYHDTCMKTVRSCNLKNIIKVLGILEQKLLFALSMAY